jgi:NAD-dependent DNA ligase
MPDVLNVMEAVNPDALRGAEVSITGHLGRPRAEIVELIRQAGGSFQATPSSWVGSRRAYLITNKDWNAGATVQKKASLKLLKAQEKGIKIISEKEFYDMITLLELPT